jgi:hypothetical protein
VLQLADTFAEARARTAGGRPSIAVFLFSDRTPLPGPGVAGGLGGEMIEAMKRGEVFMTVFDTVPFF